MAKLNLQSSPGSNAGEKYAKTMRIADIIVDPEFSKVFDINKEVEQDITESIKKDGYDKSQPVVVWKGENILLDGHTRRKSSIAAGLEEILVTEKDFENRAAALNYVYERQVVRRNLTGGEILTAIKMMPTGKGLSIAKLAERLGVSKSTVNKAIDVVKNSSDEDIQAINSGDMTIYEANAKNRKARQGNPIDKEIENQERLPDFSDFLRTFLVEAIVILTEANQQAAVNLLFNHFLEAQDEQEEFYQILPENIKEKFLDEKVY